MEDEEGEGDLWKRKIEEIRKFQRERPQQEITGEQAENKPYFHKHSIPCLLYTSRCV